jgi:hypothetical protein
MKENEWVSMCQHPAFACEMLPPIDYLHQAYHLNHSGEDEGFVSARGTLTKPPPHFF